MRRYGASTSRAKRHLPAGVQSIPLRGAGETMFWLPEHGTLIPGDRILGAPGGVRVYDVASQPLDRRALNSMASFMAAHPRGRYGAVSYDLSDFGLDARERRRALAFYTQRFGVTTEP